MRLGARLPSLLAQPVKRTTQLVVDSHTHRAASRQLDRQPHGTVHVAVGILGKVS